MTKRELKKIQKSLDSIDTQICELAKTLFLNGELDIGLMYVRTAIRDAELRLEDLMNPGGNKMSKIEIQMKMKELTNTVNEIVRLSSVDPQTSFIEELRRDAIDLVSQLEENFVKGE